MVNFDCIMLKDFLDENIDFLIGGRVQKIQQPTRRDFILSIRNFGESRKFYINICPQYYHICFMYSDNEKRRKLVIPKQPPMFCMLLRKYLEGCRISDAKVIDNERIFELHFEIMDELSQERSLSLCIELMGKHSNVILYDRKSLTIIGCAHNIGAEKSKYRELQGGLKYIYPPTTPCPPAENGLRKLLPEQSEIEINNLIDDYYSDIQAKNNMRIQKQRLLDIVMPRLKKVNNSLQKISMLVNKDDNTEKYKLYGELLTANLYKNYDYQKNIELFDYVNNVDIVIDLDEQKTLKENAQRYFKLYAKSKKTKDKSMEMLESLKIEKEYLENIVYSINCVEDIDDFQDIKDELGVISEKNSTKEKKSELTKIRIKDFDVYIGKNNKQNDYIVSKFARDNDYWFHTRLCAGSHVLLRVNDNEPDEDVIFECCKLARKFSSAVLPSKVGVIYTKAKNLRKPPASPLGFVTYKNEKEVLI